MFSEKKQAINASCNINTIGERIIHVCGCIALADTAVHPSYH